jgi:hypothetical protein
MGACGSMTVVADEQTADGFQVLGRLEAVDPRSIWAHEALNFTPWLAQNADRLTEALGIELEFQEMAVGLGFRTPAQIVAANPVFYLRI